MLFKRSPEEWKKVYLLGQKREYAGAEFGKKFAKAREDEDDGGDEDIAYARTFLPSYPQREVVMQATVGPCSILGRFDGYDPERNLIADDKTTRKIKDNGKKGFQWTQQKVDKAVQLTWYDLIYWKNFGRHANLELNWFDWDSMKLKTFKTSRGTNDSLILMGEIKKVWSGVLYLCEETYNNI